MCAMAMLPYARGLVKRRGGGGGGGGGKVNAFEMSRAFGLEWTGQDSSRYNDSEDRVAGRRATETSV